MAVRQEERRGAPAWALGRQVLSDVRTLNALGYFVIFRGLTWLLAAALVAVGNAPAAAYGPLLLLALVQTVALMAYRPGIRQRVRGWLEHAGIRGRFDDYLIIGTLDILLGLMLLAASGGWRSPFYHYAVVAVMIPGFVSGFGGAFRWATAYAAAYLLVVLYIGGGLEGLMLAGGLSSALSGAVTPYLIAVAVSYYGQVSRLLEEEKERVEAALADNARLTAEKEALAAERERDRIAREIHDGIAQSLYILSLQLEACADLARREPPDPQIAARLDTLVALARQSLWEVRQFIFDLKPLLAGDRTLREALAGLVREFGTVSGLPVALNWNGEEPPLSPRARAAAYRILQEALANVYKHAQASRATVDVRCNDRSLTLVVEDDGSGFAEGAATARATAGYGLPGMRTRAQEAGGGLHIESAPGRGTRVAVMLPAEGG